MRVMGASSDPESSKAVNSTVGDASAAGDDGSAAAAGAPLASAAPLLQKAPSSSSLSSAWRRKKHERSLSESESLAAMVGASAGRRVPTACDKKKRGAEPQRPSLGNGGEVERRRTIPLRRRVGSTAVAGAHVASTLSVLRAVCLSHSRTMRKWAAFTYPAEPACNETQGRGWLPMGRYVWQSCSIPFAMKVPVCHLSQRLGQPQLCGTHQTPWIEQHLFFDEIQRLLLFSPRLR